MKLEEGIRVTCAIIQDSKGNILLCQRPMHKDQGGKWEFPGGKLEKSESAEACIVREIREELGVQIRIIKKLAECSHTYPNKIIILVPFVCHLEIGEKPRLYEHEAMIWVKPEDALSYPLPEADERVLREYLKI
jgi:8-oxo-dGTP diphosphatase